MEKTVIQPQRQRFEILFVLISTVAVLAAAGGLIAINKTQKEAVKLKNYQISAFSVLTGSDQGIFSDLYTAALEIEAIHRDNGEIWATVEELKNKELALSPFVEDASWKTRGQHNWRLFTYDQPNVHRAVYVGRSGDENAAGNFIVLCEHFHSIDGSYYFGVNKQRPYSIWYNKNWSLPSDISEGTLVASGWKEAIPYSGKDELKRLNRD
jgi:hypothetical protein